MTRHLTDEEILDLASETPARIHLDACVECRARIEAERPLSVALAGLAEEADPPRDAWPGLRARIEAEGRGATIRELPGRRPARPWTRAVLQTAAAVALLALGAALGRTIRPDGTYPRPVDDPLMAATEVQRTGTEYVAAIARFRDLTARGDRAQVDQARDVALAAVHGAAWELTRLDPADATARAVASLTDGGAAP